MFFDVLWVLINIYMVASEILEIRSIWLDHRTWRFFYNHYVKNVWNVIDWVGIVIFLYMVYGYVQVRYAINDL
jgi:hypothetical protein